MGRFVSDPAAEDLPRWLVVVGSALIVLHLGALVIWVLAAPSGPWPMMDGPPERFTPPQFAATLSQGAVYDYLKAIKLTHNYHFLTNRPGTWTAYLEVHLKDEAGKEIATVKFPEDGANFWVHHRETILANWLTDDVPVMPPQGEVIPAPHQQVPKVPIWDETGPRQGRLRWVEQHLVPRDRPVSRPSEAAVLLAQAYARYQCRLHGAHSAEVIRHAKAPMPPVVLFEENLQPGAFDELISDFGEWELTK